MIGKVGSLEWWICVVNTVALLFSEVFALRKIFLFKHKTQNQHKLEPKGKKKEGYKG